MQKKFNDNEGLRNLNLKYSTLRLLCRMVKIEHSIFALPYAWAGSFLACRSVPPWKELFFLTLGMVAVRTFAMTFNRIVDLKYDRENPRTKDRPLVTGEISLRSAYFFCAASALVFAGACYMLNMLCFWLSFAAIAFSGAYSFLKRISPICHYWLGATLGLAPIAGWLAVNPHGIGMAPVLLFLAVTFWVGAFDIYYAFQDMDFDMRYRLHSFPADMGQDTALVAAGFSHILTVIFLLLAGWAAQLAWPWYFLCAAIGILLYVEHRLVKPDDLRHVNTAFFTLNGIISPLVLAGVVLGLYL